MSGRSSPSPPRGSNSYSEHTSPPARAPPSAFNTRPIPRPTSSVYSEYVPPYLDPQRSDRVPLLSGLSLNNAPQRSAMTTGDSSTNRVPPVIRGREQPFPPPIGRQYPVAPPVQYQTPSVPAESPIPGLPPLPDILPPRRRIERGRGIVRSATTGGDFRRRADNMYFDHVLGEWRPIPSNTQMGVPEESWDDKKEDTEGDEDSAKKRRKEKLKKLGRGFVQVVKDLTNHQDKKDRDDEERKANLLASISAPLGTSRHSRR